MSNNKPKESHKKKISFSLNEKISDKLTKYLEENDIKKRSKYIEDLIRKDLEKRGKNVDRDF